MVVTDPDQRDRTRDDLEAAERVRELLDAGLAPDAVEESARVMAMALSQVAASHREMVAGLVVEDDGGEGDGSAEGAERSLADEVAAAERLEGVTRALVPLIGPSLEHLYKLQLREQLRHAVIDDEGRREGRALGVDEVAIAFADLVDFTRLGEQLPPEEFGDITRRFARLASEAAGGRVRLVKMIGDAAMFSSPEPALLADAVLGLLELMEKQEGDFPSLRAGMAYGSAVARGGDLYGRPVNLASRLTDVARPGSLLFAGEGLEALEADAGLQLSSAGHKRLKGIDGAVHMYRVRRSRAEDEPGAEPPDEVDEAEEPVSSERRGSRKRRSRRS
jgi:adenylate cyclase